MKKSYLLKGFTLIELSVVLIIIGLLAAGVLVGRDLIRGAKIRAQIAQVEKINAAVNAFRLKYGCLPGDCSTASTLGLGGTDGNGNDLIEASPGSMASGPEIESFWYHLSQANLINGGFPLGDLPGVNSPPLRLEGIGITGNSINGRGGFWLSPGAALGTDVIPNPPVMKSYIFSTSSSGSVLAEYFPADAYAFDSKVDDGYPLSGAITVLTNGWGGCVGTICTINPQALTSHYPNLDACIDDSHAPPATYNITANGSNAFDYNWYLTYMLCAPQWRFQF